MLFAVCGKVACALAFALAMATVSAQTPEQIGSLVSSDSDKRYAALNEVAASGDEKAIPFLQALAEGNVQSSAASKKIVILVDGKGVDAVSGAAIDKLPTDLEEVIANNVFRRELSAAIATLRLASGSKDVRLAAAKTLQDESEGDRLPLVERAIAKETDAEIKALLERVRANLQLNSKDKAVRLAAIVSLGSSVNPNSKTVLLEIL